MFLEGSIFDSRWKHLPIIQALFQKPAYITQKLAYIDEKPACFEDFLGMNLFHVGRFWNQGQNEQGKV